MIRIVIGLFVFAVVLCAWIVIGPTRGGAPEPVRVAEAPVDRLGAGVEAAAVEAAVAEAVADVDVTRDAPPQVESFQPALRQVTRVIPDAPAIRTDDSTLSDTTAAVLAGLGLETGAPIPEVGDEMGEMTSGILSGIRAVTGQSAEPGPATPLQELVITSLQAGRTDAEIDDLINTAAVSGDLTVPEVLVTANGRVDTSVLLASIITEARVASGLARPEAPQSSGGDGVEVRVVQTATETEQFQFYTVAVGDSLGRIAIKFYGDATFFPRIFEANRATLSSPDRIRVGQRLVIPRL